MNLVLHHGIFGFAALGPIVYFNGVSQHLRTKFPGLRILVTQVALDGTIARRGTELGQQIAQAVLPGGALAPDEPVHIIAHSMGGLDARFLLSPANQSNMANRIVSLTTVATPHQGSPIADVIVVTEDALVGNDEDKLLGHALRTALAQAHIHVGGLRDLTTDGVRRFNAQFPDNASTKKFSVAGVGRGIKVFGVSLDTCVALRLAYRIIMARTGEDNDGLVSLGSATWGSEVRRWPADHADEIGHNLDLGLQARPFHFDYLAEYEVLVDRLTSL
ncbi:MAG: esterase/lipase family protein [Pyrinomonadaceae bacterium]